MKISHIILLIIIFIIIVINLIKNKKKEKFTDDKKNLKEFKNVWLDDKKGYNDAINLLKYFHNFCKKHNINYFIHYGTLIGQKRHDGFIPWDDDIDVAAEKDSFEKIFNLLENDKIKILKYQNFYKLYYKNNESHHKYPWTWPFIDIFLYRINNDKIFIGDVGNKEYEYFKNDFLPTKEAKFEKTIINIPKNSIKFLNNFYKKWDEICISSGWNHKYEHSLKEITLPCKDVM